MKKGLICLFLYIIAYADIKGERASQWVKDGFLYYQKGDFQSAIACYKKALYIEPNFASAWYWYGNALFRYGMEDMAKVCYERYLKLSEDPYIKDKIERYWGEKKEEYTHIFTIEGDVKDTGRFSLPFGIYIDRLNNLYVAGFGNDVLLKFSPFGKEILRIKHKNLKKPFGVCVDDDGNIYATSFANHCVLKFSPAGKLISIFGKKGIKDGSFISPKGITVDSFGGLYVVDQTRMQKFSKDGKFIGKIENLISPNNVCLDNNGYIFICEGSSIKKFDSSFNYISEVKVNGKWSFVYENNLYISTDSGISLYSKDLRPIKEIGLNFPPYSFSFNKFGFLYISAPLTSKIYAFSHPSNIDLIVNRIDLMNYPIVLFGFTLQGDKDDITGLSSNNFRILEENRYIYPVGVTEIKERLGLVFVIEDSKYIKKKEVKRLLSSLVKQFKDGVNGAGIISFSNTSLLLSDFTLNKTKIRDAIDSLSFKEEIKEEAFISALNKGITSGAQFLSKKAIIVLTSIKCKNETDEIKRLMNYAKNNGIPIFIIDYKGDKDRILERLCKVSGGDYLLARNSKEIDNFYNFIKERLSTQAQYIVYYYSENADLKWKNEWVSLKVEIGQGKFGICEELSYLVPSFGGAYSSLGRTLIEHKLYQEQEEKIKMREKEKEKVRKEIKEILKAKEEALKAKKEEKKEEKKKEEKEEEKKEEKH